MIDTFAGSRSGRNPAQTTSPLTTFLTQRRLSPQSMPSAEQEEQGKKKPMAMAKTYRGNCHCGAFIYEADLPEIKSVSECNCTVCHKKGLLHVYTSPQNIRVVKGNESALTAYLFGLKRWPHMVIFPAPLYPSRAMKRRLMKGS